MSHEETIKYEEMQQEMKEELEPEKFYEVFGRKVTESERDKMTMEIILVEISNGIREYHKRGGDPRILHDSLINTFSYRELTDFVSDADAFLRVPKN